ncbi:MAG: DUF2490 domain-containing protein [Bryobacterales bacterium]|nr:DUF2490 domain-containing protein [Bryobacterales bacterium]
MILSLVARGTVALAQVSETQHAFEWAYPLAPKLDLIVHSRLRTQPSGLGLYQGRMGPIFDYNFTPRLSLLGGYYFTLQTDEERDVRGRHRFFGGVEVTAIREGRHTLDVRTLTERFTGAGTDFTRNRNRARWTYRAKVSPYLSGELFLDAKGWRSTRFSGGVRYKVARFADLDLGYFYEPRRADLGPHRHMFLTSIHFRKIPGKRADPDI